MGNILSYSDTLLLTDMPMTETLGMAMPIVVEILRTMQQRPQGLYAAACIANAAFNPRLVGLINQNGGNLSSTHSSNIF